MSNSTILTKSPDEITMEDIEKEMAELAEEQTESDTSTSKSPADAETSKETNPDEAEDKQTEDDFEEDNDNFISDEEPSTENAEEDTTDWKKRYSDQQRYVTELKESLKTQEGTIAELETAVQNSSNEEISEETIKAYIENYPTSHAVQNALIGQAEKKIMEEVDKRLGGLKDLEKKTAQAELMQKLVRIHPDARSIKKDEKFKSWYAKQPEDIKKLFQSGSADVVATGLDLYKVKTGVVKDTVTEKRKKDSVDVASSTKPSEPTDEAKGKYDFTESQIDKMSVQEYERNYQAISEAQSKGRVLFDISGK